MPTRIHSSLTFAALVAGAAMANSAWAITPTDLAGRLARNENIIVIDLRSATFYANGHVPGAINIPLGLLPYKQLPTARPVIVYGDGLGVIDERQALAEIRAKPGVNGDVLEGGYAAWLAQTRLTTGLPGVTAERLPGITYSQLLAAGKDDMVLVDLRGNGAVAPAAAGSKGDRQAATAAEPDTVSQFAAKIGVPVVKSEGSMEGAVTRAQSASLNSAGTPVRAAAPAVMGGKSARLLVLVADDDTAANEAARQLRASGEYRFTILIGGTESIRREGRVGSGRMDGSGSTTTR